MKNDPRWLEKNTVLGANFGTGKQPRMPARLPADEKGEPRSALAVGEALYYQLEERTYFVKPPDAIVADLYASLADLAYASAKAGDVEVLFADPASMYERALEYGTPSPDRVHVRKRQFASDYPGDRWVKQIEQILIR